MLPITGVNIIIFLFLLETFVWNYFEFGPAVLEKNLKFWILSNGGHFLQLGDTFWAILVESIMRNICMKLFWIGACCLKCSVTEISHLFVNQRQGFGYNVLSFSTQMSRKFILNLFGILAFMTSWNFKLNWEWHFFITFYNFGPDNKFFCSEFGYEII